MASLASDDLSVDGQLSAGPAVLQRLLPSAALLLGAVSVGCAGAVGVIGTTGASGATSVPLAVWTLVLPGLLAAVLTLVRPRLGAAFAGGAGALAVIRLLMDVFVLAEPAQVVRPEFYFPSTTQVHPVGISVLGAVLLIAGDLLLVAGGVLGLRAADRGVRGLLAADGTTGHPSGDTSYSSPSVDPPADRRPGTVPGVPDEVGAPVAPVNVRMMAVGLFGVAIAVVLTVQVPYRGGYLDDFYSIPSDHGSTLGPFLLALLAAGVVVRAAGFPRGMATALLGGAATMFLVPMLTAVLAVSGGARTALATPPLFLPIGLLVMVGAGLLSTLRWSAPSVVLNPAAGKGRSGVAAGKGRSGVAAGKGRSGTAVPRTPDSGTPRSAAAGGPGGAAPYAARPSEPIGLVGAGLGALAGVAAILAPTFGMLRVNGSAPGPDQQGFLRTGPVVGSGVDSVLAVPAVIAGVVLIGGAVVVVLGLLLRRQPLVAAARTASALVVVLPLVALAGPLSTLAVLSTGQSQTSSALSGNAPVGFEVDVWSAGPGVWSLVAALALALAAATCSSTALARRSEEMTWGPDDDAADADRQRRWSIGAAVTVLAILSTSFGVWELPGGTASTFFGGDAAWTCWLLVLGVAVAAVVIAVARSAPVVLGAAVGAAVLIASRLFVPSGIAGAPGFVRPWGWYLGLLVVAAILAMGVLTARWVGSAAGFEADMGSAPHVDNRSKPIGER